MSCQVNPPYVGRDAYRMPGPLGPVLPRRLQNIYLHHSVMPTSADPCADFRRVAQVGVDRFGLASYSYALHPSGVLGELQGNHKGAHTAGHNSDGVALVLLGNYETDKVTDDMLQSACWLVWLLRGFGIVTDRPTITPHRSVKPTACPGRNSNDVLFWMRLVASDPTWQPGCRS